MIDILHRARITAGIISRRVLTGPLSVQVGIVDACNYRCIMCTEHTSEISEWGVEGIHHDYHTNKQHRSTVMDLEVFKSLTISLRRTGTRRIIFSGIGEPLLHKKVVEAVAFARSLGMGVRLSTNGARLDQELIKDLVAAGLSDLNVSINAGARDEYGIVHSGEDEAMFDQIVGNLVWLKEYKKKHGLKHPRIYLSNVVCSYNSHRCVDMMRLGVKVGAYSVSYRPIDVFSETESFALKESDYEKLHNSFGEALKLAQQHRIVTDIDTFDELVALRTSSVITAPCFAGWLFPFILANGDVTYCCISREVLGNLHENSFEEIWFAPSRRKLNDMALRIHRTQRPVPKSRCFGCERMLQNQKVYRFLWPLWGRPLKNPSGMLDVSQRMSGKD